MRSLSARVTLLVVVAVVLVVGSAAAVMDHLVDADMRRRFDTELLTQAQILVSMSNRGPQGLIMKDVSGPHLRMLSGRSKVVWAAHCADGSVQTSSPAPEAYPPAWRASASGDPTYATVMAGKQDFRAVWFRFDVGEGNAINGADSVTNGRDVKSCQLLFMRSQARLEDVLGDIDDILLTTPIVALLIVLLAASWLVRRGLRPLHVLGERMRDVGPRVPGRRLEPVATRELAPLVTRFNETLARMDEGMAREREFAGALAHETRTRLAELRTLVDVELRYPSGRSMEEILQEIGAIGGGLQRTVSGLLLLTRLDARIEKLRMVRIDMADVLARHIEHLAPVWQGRGLRVTREHDNREVHLIADESLLDIIVGNVLGNACAYAPDGTSVRIRLDVDAWEVSNQTPDLDHDEVARFGQRFWSKHHGSEGHAGLGLALAGAAAQAMGFELTFRLDGQRRLHARLGWRTPSESVHISDTEAAG